MSARVRTCVLLSLMGSARPAIAQQLLELRDDDAGTAVTRDLSIAAEEPADAEDDPDTTYNGVNLVDGNPNQSVLLSWDLSALPPGTEVQSAALSLDLVNTATTPFVAQELLQSWVDTEATWKRPRSGVQWGAPGARAIGVDRGEAVLCSLVPSALGRSTYAFTDAGVAIVQRWVNTPATNRGFILSSGSAETDGFDFGASEGPAASRPGLVIAHDGGTTTFLNGVTPSSGYAGTRDTTIGDGSSSANYDGTMLEIADAGSVLLAFDVTAIPRGSILLDAGLALSISGGSTTTGSEVVEVREVLRPWDERRASWIGADAFTPWQSPGARAVGVDVGTASVLQIRGDLRGRQEIPLGPVALDLLHRWVDGTTPNHGLLLEGRAFTGVMRIKPRENAPVDRPALRVLFLPGDGGSLATGGTAADGPRRLFVGCGCGSGAGSLDLWLLTAVGYLRVRRRAPCLRSRSASPRRSADG